MSHAGSIPTQRRELRMSARQAGRHTQLSWLFAVRLLDAEASLQAVQLDAQLGRQGLAELGEPLLDLRDLGLPLLCVDRERLLELGVAHVETLGVQRLRRRDVADRGLD